MTDVPQASRTERALQRLTRWKTLLAGWQLGTRTLEDPVAAAVRDHREQTLLTKNTADALTQALIDKGVLTEDEFVAAQEKAANRQCEAYERRFPGVSATETGLNIDVNRVHEWMRPPNWPL
jgi:hypothetical protein